MASSFSFASCNTSKEVKQYNYIFKNKNKNKKLKNCSQINLIYSDPANHFQRTQPNLDCIGLHELHSANSSTRP